MLWGGLAVTRFGKWIVRSCLLLLLLVGISACGDSAPRTVIEDALRYEITHLAEADNRLVGYELLDRWTRIRSVKVRSQKSIAVSADGKKYPALSVRGTYSLAVRLPDRRSRYNRTEPFSLTLARIEASESDLDRWVLARASGDSGDRKQLDWELVEFLPLPELQPVESDSTAPPQDLSAEELSQIVEERDELTKELPAESETAASAPHRQDTVEPLSEKAMTND